MAVSIVRSERVASRVPESTDRMEKSIIDSPNEDGDSWLCHLNDWNSATHLELPSSRSDPRQPLRGCKHARKIVGMTSECRPAEADTIPTSAEPQLSFMLPSHKRDKYSTRSPCLNPDCLVLYVEVFFSIPDQSPLWPSTRSLQSCDRSYASLHIRVMIFDCSGHRFWLPEPQFLETSPNDKKLHRD